MYQIVKKDVLKESTVHLTKYIIFLAKQHQIKDRKILLKIQYMKLKIKTKVKTYLEH